MNPDIGKSLTGGEVRLWLPRLLACAGLLAFSLTGWTADEQHSAPDLTAHEWGTFTAIASKDGRAVEWLPLGLPRLPPSTDLPQFVEHISDVNFKLGLGGTIRMETPVLYFYSPRDLTVSAKVSFAKGLITEWYPHADRVQPAGIVTDTSLSRLSVDGSIEWNHVAVSPNRAGKLESEEQPNRYYAARDTASSPLRVQTTTGEQREKFLFYRGVSASPLPISARLTSYGKLVVESLSGEEIPNAILFERRGERVGYRLTGALTDATTVDPPVLKGSVDSLCGDLEEILGGQGLYRDEAHAMIETWKDSWFEEGSRLIYIVPRGFVDKILPLTIDPLPGQIVRVFVGRLEIVTPATAMAVRTAQARNDEATLDQYGRFLEPILHTIEQEH
ncbi:MAG TPA: hypothetical protein VFA40_18060 [Terriglobales bacterium]|nr:hypothetical protein [Terriglobales bacterium]